MIDLPKQINLNRYNKDVLGNRIVKLRFKISAIKNRGSHESEYLYLEKELEEMENELKMKRRAQKLATYHRNKHKYQRRKNGTATK